MQLQKLEDYSVMGLLENLDKLAVYLRDHRLREHQALFECVVSGAAAKYVP